MAHDFIKVFCKLSLFYHKNQTKRQVHLEFIKDLQKEKALQNPVTVEVYNALSETDRIIADGYARHYRRRNNAVALSRQLHYSESGIKYRLQTIVDKIYALV